MKKSKFIWLTIAGFLTNIACGVTMVVIGELTGMQYTNILPYSLIGVGLSMGLGVLLAFINRAARKLDYNTPVYSLIVQILPVMLSICSLFALPLMIGMDIVKSGMGFVAAVVLTLGTILTSGFGAIFKSLVLDKRRR